MKQSLALILAVVVLFTVTACGNQNTTQTGTTTTTTAAVTTVPTGGTTLPAATTVGGETTLDTVGTGDTTAAGNTTTQTGEILPTGGTTALGMTTTTRYTTGGGPVPPTVWEPTTPPTTAVVIVTPTWTPATEPTQIVTAPLVNPITTTTAKPTTTTTRVCVHSWKAASCTAPKTCRNCGAVEGGTLAHSWKAATFPALPTCSTCGGTKAVAYGYNDLARNARGRAMQAFYVNLYTACEAFAKHTGTVSATGGHYEIAQVAVDTALTTDEALAVYKIFKLDNPQFYWLANSASVGGGTFDLRIDGTYADGNYRRSCDTALMNLSAACKTKLSGAVTDLEKAVAIHNLIGETMKYAYKADGVTPEDTPWAHNVMGCAEKKAGVCEAYAYTFKYLCDQYDIECLTVTGKSGGVNHAWNVAKLGGLWYGVDCTFDDSASGVTHRYFGMSGSKMNGTHTADNGTGARYLYALPAMAAANLAPVELYKNGTYVKLLVNVDAAVAEMRDPAAAYEVRLGSGKLTLSGAQYHLTATQIAAVKSVTVGGVKTGLGNDSYTTTALYIDSALKLNGDLFLFNMQLLGSGSLNVQNHKVSFGGSSVAVSVPITGSVSDAAPSELYIAENGKVTFNSAVKVHTLSGYDKCKATVLFHGNTEVVKNRLPALTFFDAENTGVTMHVKEFCPPENTINPYIKVMGAGKLTVDAVNVSASRASIQFEFGKQADFGKVTVGASNKNLHFILNGKRTYVTTDIGGNTTGMWTETMDPAALTCPVATVGNGVSANQVKVFFVVWEGGAGYEYEHTGEYTLNGSKQVVRK